MTCGPYFPLQDLLALLFEGLDVMMDLTVDRYRLNEIDLVVLNNYLIFLGVVYGTLVDDRDALILEIVQLVIFILEHLVNRRQVDCLGRAERQRFGQSFLLLCIALPSLYGISQFLLIFLLHYNLILAFIQQRNPYFLLLLMIIAPALFLLLFFLLQPMDLGYQSPQIFMYTCFRIDSLDVLPLFLVLLKVLVDYFLHIVVLLRSVKINLMLSGDFYRVAVSLPRVLVLRLTLMAHDGGVEGQVDRLEASGCVAIELALNEVLAGLDVCKMDVDMVEGMMLISTHLPDIIKLSSLFNFISLIIVLFMFREIVDTIIFWTSLTIWRWPSLLI